MFHFLLPALLFNGVAASFSVSKVANLWPILVWACVQTAIGLAVGWLISLLPLWEPFLRRPIVVCISYQNTMLLPLLFLFTVCEYQAEPETCKRQVMEYLFIYVLPLNIYFFAFVLYYLRKDSRTVEVRTLGEQEMKPKTSCWGWFTLSTIWLKELVWNNAPLFGLGLGFAVGLCPPVQWFLFDSQSLGFVVGSSISAVSEPSVTLGMFIVAASFAHAVQSHLQARKRTLEEHGNELNDFSSQR